MVTVLSCDIFSCRDCPNLLKRYLFHYNTTDIFSCLSQNQQLFCNAFNKESVVFFATRIRFLFILREYHHCVWAHADFARAGQSIGSFLAGLDVRCRMIVEVWAVVVGVTVKARFP